jgi:hypothetical protein
MSFYRIESNGKGIYEAVEKDCPRDDCRRQSKPDGSWLPKVGPQYPNAISFWSENGLKKYVLSGLFDWHRNVVSAPISVRILEHCDNILYQDEFQVVVDPELITMPTVMSGTTFAIETANQWLRCSQDEALIAVALQLLESESAQSRVGLEQ